MIRRISDRAFEVLIVLLRPRRRQPRPPLRRPADDPLAMVSRRPAENRGRTGWPTGDQPPWKAFDFRLGLPMGLQLITGARRTRA